jgi:hypothetical protein
VKTWILFGMLIATLPGCLDAVAQSPVTNTGQESKLVFVIEPAKAVYMKGGDVEFIFRLSNHSDNKILVAGTFQLAHFVTLNIVDGEGRHAEWCGRIVSQTDFPRSFVALSPGESVSKKLVVSCVNKDDPSRAWGYALGGVGKYFVTGTYRLPQPEAFFKKLFPHVPAVRGPVSAKPVTIEIR